MNLVSELMWRIIQWLSTALLLTALIIAGFYAYVQAKLPPLDQLKRPELQIPLRIYTRDGKLMAEYGEVRREPVAITRIPKPLIQGVLATEDQRFFEHGGVDAFGLMRAAVALLVHREKSQGGSTITMQVARNFFLTRQKTFSRKFNEILLAIKIDESLSKQQILELYLNKIYFGQRAYGVAAAAEVYFGKPLDQLTLPEMALIAGLPQAPSQLNPLRHPKAALTRRNHVLKRMLDQRYIDQTTYAMAVQSPLGVGLHHRTDLSPAPYAAEMARTLALHQLGDQAYTAGFKIYTTVDSRLQQAASGSLNHTLLRFDQRKNYRGPAGHSDIKDRDTALRALRKWDVRPGLRAVWVSELPKGRVITQMSDGNSITLEEPGFRWALKQKPATAIKRLIQPGDVIYVRWDAEQKHWMLSQIPEVQGAFISMASKTGEILAMVGGFDFFENKFNRITQAERQPGSSFKPFLYAAALANGFTLTSVFDDQPISIYDRGSNSYWEPKNDTEEYYGPTRLREALIHSRNIVSVKLLQALGISKAVDFIRRFGFPERAIPKAPSLALGVGSITPLELTAAYAVLANGGYRVTPYLITRIEDAKGHVWWTQNPPILCAQDGHTTDHDEKTCPNEQEATAKNQTLAPRVIPKGLSYLMTSVLQDVIKYGTATPARVLKRTDLAGKTGTTNEKRDNWFVGYNPQLVACAWVGYDQPRPLGTYPRETALPMWIDFMRVALNNLPEQEVTQPEGVVSHRVDDDENRHMFEVFLEGNEPDHADEETPAEKTKNNTPVLPDADTDEDDHLQELF